MQITDMRVRRARPTDRPALLALWERSVRGTHHFLNEQDIQTLRPLVAQELASDALQWWVLAPASEEPVAFLGYVPGVIEALFVDAELVGHGCGSRLLAHAQSLCAGPLSVEVNEQNPAAVSFYSSQGFRVVSRSALDAGGRPFPILRMQRPQPA